MAAQPAGEKRTLRDYYQLAADSPKKVQRVATTTAQTVLGTPKKVLQATSAALEAGTLGLGQAINSPATPAAVKSVVSAAASAVAFVGGAIEAAGDAAEESHVPLLGGAGQSVGQALQQAAAQVQTGKHISRIVPEELAPVAAVALARDFFAAKGKGKNSRLTDLQALHRAKVFNRSISQSYKDLHHAGVPWPDIMRDLQRGILDTLRHIDFVVLHPNGVCSYGKTLTSLRADASFTTQSKTIKQNAPSVAANSSGVLGWHRSMAVLGMFDRQRPIEGADEWLEGSMKLNGTSREVMAATITPKLITLEAGLTKSASPEGFGRFTGANQSRAHCWATSMGLFSAKLRDDLHFDDYQVDIAVKRFYMNDDAMWGTRSQAEQAAIISAYDNVASYMNSTHAKEVCVYWHSEPMARSRRAEPCIFYNSAIGLVPPPILAHKERLCTPVM